MPDGGLHAQPTPLFVIDLERVAVGSVVQAQPFGPGLEVAGEFAAKAAGRPVAQEAQPVAAAKGFDAVVDELRVARRQPGVVGEEPVGGVLGLAGGPVVVLAQRTAQFGVEGMGGGQRCTIKPDFASGASQFANQLRHASFFHLEWVGKVTPVSSPGDTSRKCPFRNAQIAAPCFVVGARLNTLGPNPPFKSVVAGRQSEIGPPGTRRLAASPGDAQQSLAIWPSLFTKHRIAALNRGLPIGHFGGDTGCKSRPRSWDRLEYRLACGFGDLAFERPIASSDSRLELLHRVIVPPGGLIA